MDRDQQVVSLFVAFHDGAGIFGKKHADMPEVAQMQRVDPAARVNVLTLGATLDYQTDADRLWQAAAETYLDPATRWLFDLPTVAAADEEAILQAMLKHGFTGRYPTNNARFIRQVCQTFAQRYGGSPLGLLAEYAYDAGLIYQKRERLGDLPALKGAKIFPFWLRILHDVAGVKLKNIAMIPLPVDVHIARATYRFIYRRPGRPALTTTEKERIAADWFAICQACKRQEIYPLALDEALWLLSRNGCSSSDNQDFCPRRSECVVADGCVFGLEKNDGPQKLDRHRSVFKL